MKHSFIKNLKFIFLFAFGIFAFLIPFPIPFLGMNESSILISNFSNIILNNFHTIFIYFTLIVQVIIIISAGIGLYRRIKNYDFNNEYFNELCQKTYPIIIMKVIGALFFILIACNELGLTWTYNGNGFVKIIYDLYVMIINPDTGGTTFNLVLSLFLTFFAGNLLLPFLTEFGAVEFIGNLVSRFMQKIFHIPGYSAIDAVASFVGDGTIGILVTDRQYQKGYYTQKQAGIIATSFSIVGIAFATLVAQELGFSNYFVIFYGTILLVTVILAFIISRVNFLHFTDKYYDNTTNHPVDKQISFKEAYYQGVEICDKANFKTIFINAFKQISITYIVFVPTIMCVGTLGLILATYTDIFNIISMPFIPILNFLGFGSSSAGMAPGLLVGLADMYLPTLFVNDPSVAVSSAGKFFIGVLSFCQLVFLSETGMVLLNTKIGFKFWDLIKIFAFRTLLSIPIILIVTYILSLVGIVSF